MSTMEEYEVAPGVIAHREVYDSVMRESEEYSNNTPLAPYPIESHGVRTLIAKAYRDGIYAQLTRWKA